MANHLRPEARPAIEWDDLDRHQQDAFRVIISMLDETLNELKNMSQEGIPSRWGGFRSDSNRSARIAFLSGARGTGKTTLLLSLQQWTSSPPGDYDAHGDLQDCLRTSQRNGRLIWLEPLDMDVLPEDVNLLAAIVARIEDSLTYWMERAAQPRDGEGEYWPQGFPEPELGTNNPWMRFRRLQHDIALAWDGNLPSRAGEIDPDPYATEVFRTERSRLSLTRKLHETLEALAQQMKGYRQVEEPLFILPVDDLDLNPIYCLRLLRLLRLISVPRLFTLVLGDLDVARVVMKLQFSQRFAAASGQMVEWYGDDIDTNAANLADNTLRKLLPPGQRVSLQGMTVEEALAFRPLGQQKVPSLGEIFGLIPMPALQPWASLYGLSKETPTLNHFLNPRYPRLIQEPGTEPTESQATDAFAYSGCQYFATTPRRIADIWYQFPLEGESEERVDDPARRLRELVDWVGQTSREALERELPADQRPVAMGVWGASRLPVAARVLSERVYIRGQLDAKSGGLDFSTSDFVPHGGEFTARWPQGDPQTKEPYLSSMRIHRHGGWQFEASMEMEERHGRAPRALPFETGGVLILHHDLSAMTQPESDEPISVLEPSVVGTWAQTVWHRGDQSGVELEWPVPPCSTYWELEMFASIWNDALAQLGALPQPENLAFAWLSAGTAICERGRPERLASMESEVDAWPQLVERLGLLTRGTPGTASYQRAQEWLVRVALLMTPEMRLPPAAVARIATSSELGRYWSSQGRLIARRRVQHFAALIQGGLEPLAAILMTAQWPFGGDPIFVPDRREVDELAGRNLDWQERQSEQLDRLSQQMSNMMQQMRGVSAELGKQEERFGAFEERLEVQGQSTVSQFDTLRERLEEQAMSAAQQTRRFVERLDAVEARMPDQPSEPAPDTVRYDGDQAYFAEQARAILIKMFGFSEKTPLKRMIRQALGRKKDSKSKRFREIISNAMIGMRSFSRFYQYLENHDTYEDLVRNMGRIIANIHDALRMVELKRIFNILHERGNLAELISDTTILQETIAEYLEKEVVILYQLLQELN